MQVLPLIAWRDVASGLRATVLRFPLPVALATVQVGLAIARIHDFNVFEREDEHFRAFAFLLLAVFAALGAKLLAESRKWSWPKGLAFSLALVLLLALRAFTLPANYDAVWAGLLLPLLPAGLLFLACAPFVTRLDAGDAFWDYNRGLWLSAAFGLLVGLIFAGGLHALYAALDALFEVDIDDDVYSDTWALGLGFVWPLQAMSGVPKDFAEPEADYCPTWARYLTGFFLVPFIIAYLLLLYAYAAKTLITWDLPRGELGYLVAGYAAFGVATFLFAHPLRESGNLAVRQFCRFFHPALLVPAGLLLLAIAVRIEAYGVTEQRYAVAVFGLWLLGIALVFTFRRRSGPVLLPLSLALLLALGSFGPWGGVGLATDSQITRLKEILARNSLLAEGKALRSGRPISRDDEAEVSAIAIYLDRMGKQPALAPLFDTMDLDLQARPSASDIVTALGLSLVWPGQDPGIEHYQAARVTRLDVAPFQIYQDLSLWTPDNRELTVDSNFGRYLVQLDSALGRLRVTEENGPTLDFDLATLRKRLKHNAESDGGTTQGTVSQDQMTLENRQDGLHLRLILQGFYLERGVLGPKVVRLHGILLIGQNQD